MLRTGAASPSEATTTSRCRLPSASEGNSATPEPRAISAWLVAISSTSNATLGSKPAVRQALRMISWHRSRSVVLIQTSSASSPSSIDRDRASRCSREITAV